MSDFDKQKEYIESPEEEKVRENMIKLAETQEIIEYLKTVDIYKISDNLFWLKNHWANNLSAYINKLWETPLDLTAASELSDIEESFRFMWYVEKKVDGVYYIFPIDDNGNPIQEKRISQLSEQYLKIWKDAIFYNLRYWVIIVATKTADTKRYLPIDGTEKSRRNLRSIAEHAILRIQDLTRFLDRKQITSESFQKYYDVILANNWERLLKQCSDIRFPEIDKITDQFEWWLVTKEEVEWYYNTAFDWEKLEPFEPKKHKEEMRLVNKDLKDRCYKAIDDREQAENELIKWQKTIQEHSHNELEELQTPIQWVIKWIKEQVWWIIE